MRSFRVLTYNVLTRQESDGPRRRALQRDELRRLDPDIVALQEVVTLGDGAEAAELLDDRYTVVAHPTDSPDGVSALLATRLPCTTLAVVDLRVTERVRELPWSYAVIVRVDLPDPIGPVLVAHHKPVWCFGYERERELQAVLTTTLLDQLAADHGIPHVIALGDFDAAPESASARFWTGHQSLDGVSVAYQDAWEAVHPDDPGHTFTPLNPLVTAGRMPLERGRRIDYVLVRCAVHGPTLAVERCDRALVEPACI